ncbi:oligopeptide ABC transporter substrate-binding protein [Pseudoneobacillus sp. C159]
MKKLYAWMFAFMLILSAFLAACSDKSDKASSGNNNDNQGTEEVGPKEGGILTYALDSEFKGILNWNFYDLDGDDDILEFIDENLIGFDENLKPEPNIASWETTDNQHFTFTFEKGVKWHNGEELTVHDWVFALETIATLGGEHHRWSNVNTIDGVVAFNEGEADKISGLEVVDDYTLKVKFDKARINNLENLWTYPLSRKEFEGIAPKDMLASPQVRTKPIGTGPFKVVKVIPGESIELVRNEDYFKGKPHIEKVIIKVIDSSLTTGELKNGTVDMTPFHPSIRPEIDALDNVEIVRIPATSHYYIGFKFGKFDGKKNVMNNPKYANKKLRQAMLYALNREEWVDAFFNGLGKPINRPIPSGHWIAAPNEELPNQYTYNPKKAKELLDEAGYKDIDGDGFREDPNGDKFEVKFSHYATGNPTFEARAKAFTQNWEEVGLKSSLQMPDVNLYYDQLEKDDKALEVFYAGFGTGADPDPLPSWGITSIWNYSRWVNEEAEKLLQDAIDISVVGTDSDKRRGLYVDWQKIINEELPVLPIVELEDVMAINKRVKGVVYDISGANSKHLWWINE